MHGQQSIKNNPQLPFPFNYGSCTLVVIRYINCTIYLNTVEDNAVYQTVPDAFSHRDTNIGIRLVAPQYLVSLRDFRLPPSGK